MDKKSLNYLVTGGAGFIGSHLVSRLMTDGHRVRVLDTLESPVHSPLRPRPRSTDVEFIQRSVSELDSWRKALVGIDRVFHLAGYMDYLPFFSRYYLVNTVSTAMLFEAIVVDSLPIEKIVVASSQAIYGEGNYKCDVDGPVYPDGRTFAQLDRGNWEVECPVCGGRVTPKETPETDTKPHNAYAMSKLAMEQLAHNLGDRYGVATVALRYSIVHGPGQSPYNAYSGALRSFGVRVLNGASPMIFEDGAQYRDYVNIHDVTDANIIAMESGEANGTSLNVGGGHWTTVTELANLVIELSGERCTPEISGSYRVGDVRHIVSSVSKIETLGWRPRRSLRDGVAAYLSWLEQENVPDTFAQAAEEMTDLGMLRRRDH